MVRRQVCRTFDLLGTRGGDTTTNIGGSCAPHSGARSVGTSGPELDHGTAFGGPNHSTCFGGDKRLVVDAVQGNRLQQLSLDDRAPNRHQRLAGKHRGPVGHRPHGALGHIDLAKIVQKLGAELAQALQVIQVLLAEAEVPKDGEEVIDPAKTVAPSSGFCR